MKCTVYIPCFNAAATLPQVLKAVLAQSRSPDEVIVVDDGSMDGSAEVAAGFRRHGVQLVCQPCNRGLAAARNLALATATGDVLLGLDADVRAEADYIARAVACLESRPDCAALCGRLLEPCTSTVADRWRAVHMSQDLGIDGFANPRILFGCTTSIRREAVLRLGGWNEQFRASYEDVDLTKRLRTAGVSFRYEPSCRAAHLKRDTIESVLTGFWRWHLPAGMLRGHFESLERWLACRLEPVNWGIFRYRIEQDAAAGRDPLLPVTLLMPWWMIRHDLLELKRRCPEERAEIDGIDAALPRVAAEALSGEGFGPATVEGVVGMLAAGRDQPGSVAPPDRSPVGHDAEVRLRRSANAAMQVAGPFARRLEAAVRAAGNCGPSVAVMA